MNEQAELDVASETQSIPLETGKATDESTCVEIKDDVPEDDAKDTSEEAVWRRLIKSFIAFLWANDFLVLVVLAIVLARAYPPLGAIYLAPQITADWIAVAIIFLLSGLNLHIEEFKYATKQVHFNSFVQLYNFLVVSAVVFGASRGLAASGIIPQTLADGMVICSCLSVSINMAIVLTKACNGDEAAAIFNSAFGNLVGVFVSPALILAYLGEWGDIDLGTIFYKLTLKVLLPIAVGQVLQRISPALMTFVEKYKQYFGKIQLYCLIFIIYTVFCKTFYAGNKSSIGSIFLLVLFELILLVVLKILAWYSLKLFFKDKPRLRVMGLFGCTQKTISIGVPLINAIYENNPNVGMYTLPLIIWYPLQVMIGTMLIPRLAAFIREECERLGLKEDGDDEQNTDAETGQVISEDDGGEAEPESCVALAWAQEAIAGRQNSEFTDGEGVDVSISELDTSYASSGLGDVDPEK